MNKLEKTQQILFSIFIFLIPTNLFLKIFESYSYVQGLQVDYLIPKIHLTDFIILLLLLSLIYKKTNINSIIKLIKNNFLFFSLIGTVFLLQLNNLYIFISILSLLRISVLLAIFIFIRKNEVLNSKTTHLAIQTALLFQSFVSLYQYVFQKSFANYLFLGETNLNAYAGIAKSTLFGIEKILPYGTTAHPNVLAGIMVIYILILTKTLHENKEKNIKLYSKIAILAFATMTILLTQSISAITGLILGIFYQILVRHVKIQNISQKVRILYIVSFFITICFFSLAPQKITQKITSIERRSYLNSAAIDMIKKNFLIGIGTTNFTAHLEKYSDNREVVRFVQPVHNVFLLLLSENGLIGIVVLAIIITKVKKHKIFFKNYDFSLALLPIFLLDHYLLTIQSGLLLLLLTFLYSTTDAKS